MSRRCFESRNRTWTIDHQRRTPGRRRTLRAQRTSEYRRPHSELDLTCQLSHRLLSYRPTFPTHHLFSIRTR
jgi:hypothetical protein